MRVSQTYVCLYAGEGLRQVEEQVKIPKARVFPVSSKNSRGQRGWRGGSEESGNEARMLMDFVAILLNH